MKIIDMHIHLGLVKNKAEDIIERLDRAGVYGVCVFSAPPANQSPVGKSFEERLSATLEFCKKNPDRLYPVMWINPYEENIIENIDLAVKSGVVGFKMICSGYFVYEDMSIKVLTHIASHGKPVFFHTGILWDGMDSSKYNRPANWEALIGIKGLRFSMGHCSWPWIDECIAVYGKFLDAYKSGIGAEIFFDLTPGTPQIYREELLTKIFTLGYDVGNNILFGTDCSGENYSVDFFKTWFNTDRKIMDKLGIKKEIRENIYYNNVMRFLGKSDKAVEYLSPQMDEIVEWTPFSENTAGIVEKWYKKLGFPALYNREFENALKDIRISDAITIEDYDMTETDGKRNLLSYLFFCEKLEEKYSEKGIPSEILIDTLGDIVIWNDVWSDLKGELYLGEIEWLKRHLEMKLFKLGRLQFCMAGAEADIPSKGICKGDNVIEIHIPATTSLTAEECKKSIEMAKKFFAKYFPEFEYKCFTCHSWLLDETLKEILPEESNIVKFMNMFEIVHTEKSDAILRYTFKWNSTRNTVKNLPAASSLAQKVKERIAKGGDFFEATGVIEK